MTTHNQATGLTALRDQVAACATACVSAAGRAQDTHLQTRLNTLAGQVDAMVSRIEAALAGGHSLAPATFASLMQAANVAAAAMQHATEDDGLYQAMPAMQQLCNSIQQDVPGR